MSGFDEDLWQESFAKFLLDNPETDAIFARNDRLAATAQRLSRILAGGFLKIL